MSVEADPGTRFCDWPGCPSSYPLWRGPASPGWRSFGVMRPRAVLCPFHSVGEHQPRFIPITPDADLQRPGCSCDWMGALNAHAREAVLGWQQHVREVEPWDETHSD